MQEYFVIGQDGTRIDCNPEDFFGEGCRDMMKKPDKEGLIIDIYTRLNGKNQVWFLYESKRELNDLSRFNQLRAEIRRNA